MAADSLIAIDVAILVPAAVADEARRLNAALAHSRSDELRLDDTHLPHITLAQQFVERERLDDLHGELDRVLRHEPPLLLGVSGATADHGTIYLLVDAAPDLQRVHEQVMDAIEPFAAPDGATDAFRRNGETIRPQDVNWVRNYRENSAYSHFRPHVTVGHAESAPAIQPIDFRADRIAACQLGRFCTCRTVLRDWTLRRTL